MKYRDEWRGRLRLQGQQVRWDGLQVGCVVPKHQEGAVSPGGMRTNMVFVASRKGTQTHKTFESMTQALTWLVEPYCCDEYHPRSNP